MAILDTLAQFYAWSWIATIGALLLPLIILFARDARRSAQRLDARLQESLLPDMLMSLGIDAKVYVRSTDQPALAQQLSSCESCERRSQCAQDLSQGKAQLTECPNAEPITLYFASRGMPA